MIPRAIRKTILASAGFGIVGGALWGAYDWRSGLAFAIAVGWAILNIVVWTRLIQNILTTGKRNPMRVLTWVAAKVGLLAAGVAALWLSRPLTVGQAIAVPLGVFSVLGAATFLALMGAFLASEDEPAARHEKDGSAQASSSLSSLCVVFVALLVSSSPFCVNASQEHVRAGVALAAQTSASLAGYSHSSSSATNAPQADSHEADTPAGEEKSTLSHDGEAAHGAPESAAAHHGEEAAKPELPNLISIILQMKIGGVPVAETPLGHFLHTYEYQIFLVIITLFLCGIILLTRGLRALVPGPTQALLEIVVEGFYNFFTGILGSRERARRHMPFFGSLFLFIWFNNMFGIIPLFTGATSTFQLTASLAVLVFFYVHVNAIREAGFKHWFMHLLQDPKDLMGWILAPVFFVLHLIGELAKPLSLSLRLFGNITGEHILSGVFLILGLMLMSAVWPHPWVGVPLHLPFLFLSLLVGTIQATVFTLLATIYLALFLPHDEHHSEAAQGEAAEGHAH